MAIQSCGRLELAGIQSTPGSRCSLAPCRRPRTFSRVGFPSQLPFCRGSSPGPIVSVKLASQTGCHPDTTEEVQRDRVFDRKSLKVHEGEKTAEEAYTRMYLRQEQTRTLLNAFCGSSRRQFRCCYSSNSKKKTPKQRVPWVLPEGFSGKFLSNCQLSRTPAGQLWRVHPNGDLQLTRQKAWFLFLLLALRALDSG